MAGTVSKKRSAPERDGGRETKKAKMDVKPAVHPFFTKGYRPGKQEDEDASGTSFVFCPALGLDKTCLYGVNRSPLRTSKIAAFDLDGTLIKSTIGAGTSKSKSSSSALFEWWHPSVPAKLRGAVEAGYTVVIVSNQGVKPKVLETWRSKVRAIADALPDVSFYIFAATAKDIFRKPLPGIWDAIRRIWGEVQISVDESFFVGDAAGRRYPSKGKKENKDFADSDRKWAANAGLRFSTPEEYFLEKPVYADYVMGGFDAKTFEMALPPAPTMPSPSTLEVIVFAGPPCLGKSSFYRKHFQPRGYVHINQDTLKSRDKCVKKADEALQAGIAVVIDNTNRDKKTRALYVNLAKKHGVSVRCFVFGMGDGEEEQLAKWRKLAEHNNVWRAVVKPYLAAAAEHAKVITKSNDPENTDEKAEKETEKGKETEVTDDTPTHMGERDSGSSSKKADTSTLPSTLDRVKALPPPQQDLIPALVLNKFYADWESPTSKEGFSAVESVMEWSFEGTDKERRVWEMWLT
ncbi:PNK3P-domain-containing protein [Cylindrobasidium torrendii FP15055 ss-10]|uniref:PNK3P-domain-containing protein n=1 Tax=Cylindrobasidium torrendii FP15055 ss-10 TaxID=1314674 RepID=A0A0D7B110_9AGAR|nr:PNK3P-domain-containing protein [Cylindrobasidium torrendii FP15055 ss-10]